MKLRRTELKKARIEIIPMIDTIFFLLVYFMLTSLTMVQMSAFKVALPQSSTAEGKPTEKVVISLSQSGQYYVDKQPVAEDQIDSILRDRVAQNPYIVVIINVDKDQTVDNFIKVMNMGEAVNPGDLVIATRPAPRS